MYLDQKTEQFMLLNQASASVAAGLTANVNTFALSYPTATDPSNRPSNAYKLYRANGTYYVVMQFLLKDASAVNNLNAVVNLWGWSSGYSTGVLLLTATITAGTAVSAIHPTTNAALTGQWGYADLIEISTNNIWAEARPEAAANGVAQLWLDPRGIKYLFADYDCDGGGSVCDDVIGIIREY